jgi:hypothetical protein
VAVNRHHLDGRPTLDRRPVTCPLTQPGAIVEGVENGRRHEPMSVTTIAVLNGVLVAAVIAALAFVCRIPYRPSV